MGYREGDIAMEGMDIVGLVLIGVSENGLFGPRLGETTDWLVDTGETESSESTAASGSFAAAAAASWRRRRYLEGD